MPRIGITVAKTHKGEWQLLATPDDNFIEQRKRFREMRVDKAHKDFALVIYQENDSMAEVLKLITPAEKKKLETQKASLLEGSEKLGEINRGEVKEPEPTPEPKS